jgi:hypothetical protein
MRFQALQGLGALHGHVVQVAQKRSGVMVWVWQGHGGPLWRRAAHPAFPALLQRVVAARDAALGLNR